MPKISDLVNGPNAIYDGERLKCPFCRTVMLIETIEKQNEDHADFHTRAVEPYQRLWTVVKNKNLYNFVCPMCGSKMISPTIGYFSENIRIEEA